LKLQKRMLQEVVSRESFTNFIKLFWGNFNALQL
jgi:hypothetical protein